MKLTIFRATAAVAVGATAAIGLSAIAQANSNGTQACSLYSYAPGSGVNVWVTTGRQGCSGSVGLDSWLVKNRTLTPDFWVNQKKGSGVNFMLRPTANCNVGGTGNYHGDVTATDGSHLRGVDAYVC